MFLILDAVGWLALALAAAGTAYAVLAAVLIGRMARAQDPRAAVPASLLKPLCGDEPSLSENLQSFIRQDYGAPVQIVFGAQDPADPALQVVERLRHDNPNADIAIATGAPAKGANRKICNLINMAAYARHGLLVLSDADMRVSPDYLSRVAGAAEEPGVGAVTCFYFGQGRTGFWSRIAAMGISYGFLPNVVVGVGLGLAKPCMGSTIALKRHVLDEIGGFEAFSQALADDYEIGHAVRAKGYRTVLPGFAVAHGCSEASFGQLISHELRWAVTIRCMDPVGHAGSIVTHPLPMALIATLLLGAPAYAWAGVIAAIAARALLVWRVDRSVGVSSGPWQALLLRDILSFGVFVCSLFARRVDWRGSRFRISANGKLYPA